MKKSSNIILFSFILLTIITMIIIISKDSMAYEYNENDINLFYKEDKEELAKDIKLYIENIDDIILPNSSFNYSDKLNENYDFLTYFALKYITENYDIYKSDIVKKEKYEYTNLDFETKITEEYINIETIYKITDKYFGVKDFVIVNNDVNIIDNYISIIEHTKNKFTLEIKNVEVKSIDKKVIADITYDDNSMYRYTFNIVNKNLKIENIEVLS